MYRKEDLKKDLQKYAYYDKNCEKKALSCKIEHAFNLKWKDLNKKLQDNPYISCETIVSYLLDPHGAMDIVASIKAAKRKSEFLSEQYIIEKFELCMEDYRTYIKDILDNLKFIRGLEKIEFRKCPSDIKLRSNYDIENYMHLPFQCVYEDNEFFCPNIGRGLYISIFSESKDFFNIFATVPETVPVNSKKYDNAIRYILQGLQRERLEFLAQESEWWDWYSHWIWINHIDFELISYLAEEIGKQCVNALKNRKYIDCFLEVLAGCYTPAIRHFIGEQIIPDFVECLKKDDKEKQNLTEGCARLKKVIDMVNNRICLFTDIMLEISNMRADKVLYPRMIYQFMQNRIEKEYLNRLSSDQS